MSLRERAYESFTQHLLDRDLAPGQFVSQRELVELTGYPLGAVREMIPRLESDGLIRTVPHRGLQIAHVDMDLIRNAFQLRLLVEREAVAHFAQTAPAERIEALREAHLRVRALAERDVTPELNQKAQQLDWDLHDEMVASLGNALITDIYRVNSIKIRLIRTEDTRMLPELVVSVMDEHLALIEALAIRDKAASVAALEAHVESAKRRVVRV
ncbi:GntR family transcriptional regulator [Pacificitalea manganoxidans]|uniref:GntR family transcriptional regulator n=1 Tax=Pacificitalea manganoxidans TaxID=1411902 RepID=A0A291LZC2_9RHOB|nr:GntR family transcriptional regulator [Pacificitalea manganoxidans]ATI42020.1 GntR family transcriptional regulator [Pacificitalea manganoxidans]MDR6309517.1 DNA-binding GntR family transcriptional regulator [Pacificitalea manganoxidans]